MAAGFGSYTNIIITEFIAEKSNFPDAPNSHGKVEEKEIPW